jgi:hypothetical protein
MIILSIPAPLLPCRDSKKDARRHAPSLVPHYQHLVNTLRTHCVFEGSAEARQCVTRWWQEEELAAEGVWLKERKELALGACSFNASTQACGKVVTRQQSDIKLPQLPPSC